VIRSWRKSREYGESQREPAEGDEQEEPEDEVGFAMTGNKQERSKCKRCYFLSDTILDMYKPWKRKICTRAVWWKVTQRTFLLLHIDLLETCSIYKVQYLII